MANNTYVEVAIPAKAWWQSKTMLWNIATLIAVALGLIIDNAAALGVSNQVKIWIGIALAVINAAVNLYLRAGPTNQPLASGRDQFRYKFLPKAETTRPPERPSTHPHA